MAWYRGELAEWWEQAKMRIDSRVDDNQKAITKELRQRGYGVLVVSYLREGCDIIVGYQGCNLMFEIKNPDQPPSKRRLTPREQKFHDAWRGQIDVVETVEEIVDAFRRHDRN